MLLSSTDSTIFALATPRLACGMSILRISGPDAFSIAKRLFLADDANQICEEKISANAYSGCLRLNDDLQVRGYCWKFHKPFTYTGQDIVEFHIIGSPMLIRLAEQRLTELGAKPAQPGEFTARAFLNGRINLTQAQAIRMLTEAQNDAQISSAIEMLEGKFHTLIIEEYERIRDLVSKVEANIDFSEEDIELISVTELTERICELKDRIEDLLASSVDRKQIENLPRVFIVGAANVGKSTLMNRLTGSERAICSSLAGTTRDVISAVWKRKDREVLLCDTAGAMKNVKGQIDIQALARTRDLLSLADMFVVVFDVCEDILQQVQLIESWRVNERKKIVVLNKSDSVSSDKLREQLGKLEEIYGTGNVFAISARLGLGLEELAERVFTQLTDVSVTVGQGQIALDARMRELLLRAAQGLADAQRDIAIIAKRENVSLGLEIVAESLSYSLRALGTLLGKDISEDILENIFSEFCIGK